MELSRYAFRGLLSMLAVVFISGQFAEAATLKSKDDFGTDENFGGWFGPDPNNAGQTGCSRLCESDEECCVGDICQRNLVFGKASRYGYCVKFCPPVAPGGDCRRCQGCTKGYICTIYTNKYNEDEYRCLRRN